MKKIILFFFTSFIWVSTFAQTHYCGTPAGKSKWLKEYQKNPVVYDRANDSLLWVPMTIHIVGTDQGTGYFSYRNLYDALCTLNDDFLESNIQFFIKGDINFIDTSAYYNHETVIDGAYMMFKNNVPNTLNNYFVNDPAGNCGYNLPYAGIAVKKSCASPTDHTWAHEVGHALSLPHPFLGWEGGVSYDGSIPHSYNNPAPEWVTYDYTNFKDVLYEDTLIVDTAWVEKVDGSNCQIAADGFCDTPPDYLNYRWNCDNNNMSTVEQTDPTGAKFFSDGNNVMSYSVDDCVHYFTPEQMAAMRTNLETEKANLLQGNQDPADVGEITAVPNLTFPTAGEMTPKQGFNFHWDEVDNASHYLVQVSVVNTFLIVVYEAFTDQNFLLVDKDLPTTDLFWRVRPLNRSNGCVEVDNFETFTVDGDLTGTKDLNNIDFYQIFPNPAASGHTIYLDIQSKVTQEVSAHFYDIAGREIFNINKNLTSGYNQLDFNLPELSSGLYSMVLKTPEGNIYEKILIN